MQDLGLEGSSVFGPEARPPNWKPTSVGNRLQDPSQLGLTGGGGTTGFGWVNVETLGGTAAAGQGGGSGGNSQGARAGGAGGGGLPKSHVPIDDPVVVRNLTSQVRLCFGVYGVLGRVSWWSRRSRCLLVRL